MSTMVETHWHPAACIFPMLPDDELQNLADDIREHGQLEPIVFFEGMVLDGRNRWLACKFAGVEPKIREFSGSPRDALAYVWSTNRVRRQLNSGQVSIALAKREKLDAEYAASVEAMRKAAPKNQHDKGQVLTQKIVEANRSERETDHKLAEAAGTNRTYLNQSRKIIEKAPGLAEKVERGEMTLSQASTEMRREEKRKDLEAKAVAARAKIAAPKKKKQSEPEYEDVDDGDPGDCFTDKPLWTLINQDVMDGLKSVELHHGPARLIFADPPYNIGVEYGDHHNDRMEHEEFCEWCINWMRECCNCLTDDGSLWVMINDEYAADFVLSLRDCGLTMRSWIKWYETFGVNCSNNFNRTSRHILYFVMDEDNFCFNETEALRPSDRQTKYNDSRAQSSGKIIDDVWQIPRLAGTSKERIPDFPTQLPLELVSRIVRVASEPGDLVVDPFNGSGTTGVAAVSSGRKYIGIDASEKFIDLAEKRLVGAQYDV